MVFLTELQVSHMLLFFKQLKTYAFKKVTEAFIVVLELTLPSRSGLKSPSFFQN